MPKCIKYWVALRVADLYMAFHKQCKHAVFHNLGLIYPPGERYNTAQSIFRNFAKYLADFLFFPRLSEKNWKNWVKTVNAENFDNAYKKGKGVIALTAHIGNWELGGVILSLMGYPTSAIVLPQDNKLVNIFFLRHRSSKGLKSIPLGPHLRECFERLKKGEVLAILGDRNIGLSRIMKHRFPNEKNGVAVNFFGKKAYFPKGPAVLAYWTKAVILPGFTVREKDDTYTLYFEKPISVEKCENKEKFIRVNTQKIADVIEKYVRKYPGQWCVFEEVWKY